MDLNLMFLKLVLSLDSCYCVEAYANILHHREHLYVCVGVTLQFCHQTTSVDVFQKFVAATESGLISLELTDVDQQF